MHLDHDHIGAHSHEEAHTHEHGQNPGQLWCALDRFYDSPDAHNRRHHHHAHPHDHTHDCGHSCESCGTPCEHTPMEELTALMKYMVGHNAAHAKELAELAKKLEENGNHTAYEQVMAAVSDFEKGNMRLSVVLSSLAE